MSVVRRLISLVESIGGPVQAHLIAATCFRALAKAGDCDAYALHDAMHQHLLEDPKVPLRCVVSSLVVDLFILAMQISGLPKW
jgi:hypothetical protein